MKIMFANARVAALALAASVVVLAVACRNPPPPKEAYTLGEPVVAGGLTYKVIEARWRDQLEASPTPRVPERNFLLVRVQVTNSAGAELGIPFLKVENSNGDTFTESENGAGVKNWLGLIRRISPAQTEDGWLLFDVPTNSYKLRVSDGAVENEHVAYVSVPLNMQTDLPGTQVQ